jgi:hypothetical protein
MKRKLALLIIIALPVFALAQVQVSRAFLGPDGEVLTETTMMETSPVETTQSTTVYNQLPGFPKKVGAHPNFKSFRSVTLADIDGDGADEILVAAYNKLIVYKGNGTMLWSKNLTGTAIYPPSVADMDGNGTLGIVQVTGGIPNNGRVYYMDVNGNDHDGWPLSFSNHWILCAPAIADVSGDGVCEIVFQTRTSNNLHVVKTNGTPLNENWPVNLGGTPAVTPSVADIDNDGSMEIITATSNGVMFAFDINGQLKTGFPVPSDNYGFSYQSPVLVDFDGDNQLSIVGSAHGEGPKFYARENNGAYRTGWPVNVPDNSWTYSPPTVVDLLGDGDYKIFMSRPIFDGVQPVVFGFNNDGTQLPNFPINKSGGLESFISVADIDGNGQQNLIFGSNTMIDGQGFIHAYNIDGTGELEGFPLRPFGFTYMNGANLGDVNGDGLLNLVSLSYEQNFSASDSAVVSVYNLQIPVSQANVLWSTYKGSNDRAGFVQTSTQTILPGDANCDGIVNVIDIIAIANYIMSLNPQPFCPENADTNNDGVINVMDIIGTVEIILGKD